MSLLIKLGNQHVTPAHIIQVLVHPTAFAVCVVLTNGVEIRIPVERHESREDALVRVVRHIEGQANE